ncbi:hypothetical protein RHSIM_Rhsim04G0106500 [Rhododendron simsii]|uniref:EF-hand domain-containing protein n=1 Tax=Rhododendron simsii TaxID=118357 RepID=A0A834H3D1_RHOSS|nr:hypothetical protein RHSIM_Rhsim04G0106500 [Rhododendron simsii]
MSGYPYNNPPQGYGYGGPPPSQQPYSSAPYGAPQQPPPTQNPYAPPPSSTPYAAPSAPYAPSGPKPPKDKPYGGSPTAGYPAQAQPSYGSSSPFASLVPSAFPPGTDPSIVACFQIADRDGSGLIDDKELQGALSSYNQSFSLRTVHLLMYLFTNSNSRKIVHSGDLGYRRASNSSWEQEREGERAKSGNRETLHPCRVDVRGPKEFTALYYSLQNWRSIFERFDRDRSGRIDTGELREALLSLGFGVSPVVLELLVSKFDKTGGQNRAIEYDNFIECCLTVKGLTEKFKEKDTMYSGSATFTYESFMLTVLPFLIA